MTKLASLKTSVRATKSWL